MRDLAQHFVIPDGFGDEMLRRVAAWAAINSGTRNIAGVNAVGAAVAEVLAPLAESVQRVALPGFASIDDAGHVTRESVGDAWVYRARPEAARRVLMCIHLDTVYPKDHAFQTCERVRPDRVRGPGVADAKGGIAVLVAAIELFERSPYAKKIGWTVVLNPDEEIGSPSSAPLLESEARQHQVGLVFEPTLADGAMVDRRGGSGVFDFVARGRSAHVGRNSADGRNAIHAIAKLVTRLTSLDDPSRGIVMSVGRIVGGGPVNVVPDLAIARANVRVVELPQMKSTHDALRRFVHEMSGNGITIEMHGRFTAPPKPLDSATCTLITGLDACADALGKPIQWQASGGVCDGNRLAAAGLPTLDTFGPDGGAIHSPDEFVLTTTLAHRATLAACFLAALADDRVSWPHLAPPPSEPMPISGRIDP